MTPIGLPRQHALENSTASNSLTFNQLNRTTENFSEGSFDILLEEHTEAAASSISLPCSDCLPSKTKETAFLPSVPSESADLADFDAAIFSTKSSGNEEPDSLPAQTVTVPARCYLPASTITQLKSGIFSPHQPVYTTARVREQKTGMNATFPPSATALSDQITEPDPVGTEKPDEVSAEIPEAAVPTCKDQGPTPQQSGLWDPGESKIAFPVLLPSDSPAAASDSKPILTKLQAPDNSNARPVESTYIPKMASEEISVRNPDGTEVNQSDSGMPSANNVSVGMNQRLGNQPSGLHDPGESTISHPVRFYSSLKVAQSNQKPALINPPAAESSNICSEVSPSIPNLSTDEVTEPTHDEVGDSVPDHGASAKVIIPGRVDLRALHQRPQISVPVRAESSVQVFEAENKSIPNQQNGTNIPLSIPDPNSQQLSEAIHFPKTSNPTPSNRAPSIYFRPDKPFESDNTGIISALNKDVNTTEQTIENIQAPQVFSTNTFLSQPDDITLPSIPGNPDFPHQLAEAFRTAHNVSSLRVQIPLQTPHGVEVSVAIVQQPDFLRVQLATSDLSVMQWLNRQIDVLKNAPSQGTILWLPAQLETVSKTGRKEDFPRSSGNSVRLRGRSQEMFSFSTLKEDFL